MPCDMVKKSVSKRIKITKKGKVLHRVPGLGHSRSNKRTQQIHRKKGMRELDIDLQKIREVLNI